MLSNPMARTCLQELDSAAQHQMPALFLLFNFLLWCLQIANGRAQKYLLITYASIVINYPTYYENLATQALMARVRNLTEMAKSQEDTIKNLEQVIETKDNLIVEKDKTIKDKDVFIENKEGTIRNNEETIKNNGETIENSWIRIQDLAETLKRKDKLIMELQEVIQTHEARIREFEELAKELVEKAQGMGETIKKQERTIESHERRAHENRRKLQTYREAFAEVHRKHAAEIDDKMLPMEWMKEDNLKLEAQVEKLKAINTDLMKQLESLQNNLESANAETQRYESKRRLAPEIAVIRTRVKSAAATSDQLQQDLQSVEDNAAKELQALAAKIEAESLEKVKAEAAALAQSRIELESMSRDYQVKLDEKNRECEAVTTENAQVLADCRRRLAAKKRECKAITADYTQALADYQAKLDAKHRECEALTENVRVLAEYPAKLDEKNQECEALIESAHVLAEYQAKLSAKNRECETLTTENAQVLASLAEAQEALASKAEGVQKNMELAIAERDAYLQYIIPKQEETEGLLLVEKRRAERARRRNRKLCATQRKTARIAKAKEMAARNSNQGTEVRLSLEALESTYQGLRVILLELPDTIQVDQSALREARDPIQSESCSLTKIPNRSQLEHLSLKERLDQSKSDLDSLMGQLQVDIQRLAGEGRGIIAARDQRIAELSEQLSQSQLEVEIEREMANVAIDNLEKELASYKEDKMTIVEDDDENENMEESPELEDEMDAPMGNSELSSPVKTRAIQQTAPPVSVPFTFFAPSITGSLATLSQPASQLSGVANTPVLEFQSQTAFGAPGETAAQTPSGPISSSHGAPSTIVDSSSYPAQSANFRWAAPQAPPAPPPALTHPDPLEPSAPALLSISLGQNAQGDGAPEANPMTGVQNQSADYTNEGEYLYEDLFEDISFDFSRPGVSSALPASGTTFDYELPASTSYEPEDAGPSGTTSTTEDQSQPAAGVGDISFDFDFELDLDPFDPEDAGASETVTMAGGQNEPAAAEASSAIDPRLLGISAPEAVGDIFDVVVFPPSSPAAPNLPGGAGAPEASSATDGQSQAAAAGEPGDSSRSELSSPPASIENPFEFEGQDEAKCQEESEDEPGPSIPIEERRIAVPGRSRLARLARMKEAKPKPVTLEEAKSKPASPEEAKSKPVSSEEAKSKPVSSEEAKDLLHGLIEAYEYKLLGRMDTSKFYKDNRLLMREELDLINVTCMEQAGEIATQIIQKSYNHICAGLEKLFTEEELQPKTFCFEKWSRISHTEEQLAGIIKKLHSTFRSDGGLEKKKLELETTIAGKAFAAAIKLTQVEMEGVPLPPD